MINETMYETALDHISILADWLQDIAEKNPQCVGSRTTYAELQQAVREADVFLTRAYEQMEDEP